MERLTTQNEQTKGETFFTIHDEGNAKTVEANQKLRKIEDIEANLGMPLDVLLTQVIGENIWSWDTERKKIIQVKAVSLSFDNNEHCINTLEPWFVTTHDYNEGWFLTYEEARNKLEQFNGKD